MNINRITENILRNYDETVENFIQVLQEIDCDLIYDGNGFKDAILHRKVYSVSIRLRLKKNKILSTIFPIMIGSKLDIGIRKFKLTEFKSLRNVPNILEYWEDGEKPFEKPDIAITCFLINGILKQIPFYITNDPNNVHIAKQNIVRVYRYDSEEKGKQMSLYFDELDGYKRGDLIIKLNNGKSLKLPQNEEIFKEVNNFFECPYNVKTKVYFKNIFSQGFAIDNIDNKIIISPGFLFYKLFKKTLFVPLKNKDYPLIRKKHIIVVKSIENGDLLHIISKKTIFHKEINLKNKMVNHSCKVEVQREIGENDEIFMEKKTTCYRDVNCQIYPYFPYLCHSAQIIMSEKVRTLSVLSFNDSYSGFLCIYGTSEGKNAGRSMTLAKDTFVSTQQNVNEVYKILNLKEGSGLFYVTVNSACIEVKKSCFENINLLNLKRRFKYIECYQVDNFKHINYKIGLLYKKLEDDVWVTSKELHFWMNVLYGFTHIDELLNQKGNDFITGYSTDIIKYHQHNVYPKNILTLNTLKNAILSNTPDYSLYFLETVSAYSKRTVKHKAILKPENKLSEYYTMYTPKLNLMYACFKGCTQEDCIVVHEKVNAFDCFRLYTVKLKFKNEATKYFHSVTGPCDPAAPNSFLGTIVCPTNEIVILSQTMHLIIKYIKQNIVELFFTKPNFQVLEWHISESYLFVCISSFHKFSFGDKLCNFHGQKGVATIFDSLPRSPQMPVNLIVNAYALISRGTMGPILETQESGGKDYDDMRNSDGKPIQGKTLIGPIHYYPINYWSIEHKYTANNTTKDKITGHPVKGRSRRGGMRAGGMEIFNGFIANGLAASFEEKALEHSDRIVLNGIAIPKALELIKDDAACHKINIEFMTEECIKLLAAEKRNVAKKRTLKNL